MNIPNPEIPAPCLRRSLEDLVMAQSLLHEVFGSMPPLEQTRTVGNSAFEVTTNAVDFDGANYSHQTITPFGILTVESMHAISMIPVIVSGQIVSKSGKEHLTLRPNLLNSDQNNNLGLMYDHDRSWTRDVIESAMRITAGYIPQTGIGIPAADNFSDLVNALISLSYESIQHKTDLNPRDRECTIRLDNGDEYQRARIDPVLAAMTGFDDNQDTEKIVCYGLRFEGWIRDLDCEVTYIKTGGSTPRFLFNVLTTPVNGTGMDLLAFTDPTKPGEVNFDSILYTDPQVVVQAVIALGQMIERFDY